MPDRDKVIKGLEACRKTDCINCPYHAEEARAKACLIDELLKDALTLLKEQEAIEPIIFSENIKMLDGVEAEVSIAYCGNCRQPIGMGGRRAECDNYCSRCGRRVKWRRKVREVRG